MRRGLAGRKGLFTFVCSCLELYASNLDDFLTQVQIVANEQGNYTTPSYVAFSGDERIIGGCLMPIMTYATN